MSYTYTDFLSALRMRESSGNYTLVNTLDYLGAYQFGEGALVDLGFVRADSNYHDNDYSGGWTGKLGIDSKAEFLASRAAQDAAANEWFKLVWRYLEAVNADDYLGRTVGGVRITASGLIAGAHLLGAGAVKDWLASGGTAGLTDAYGTPISEYIGRFAGYAMPFDTGEANLDDIADVLAELPDTVQARVEITFEASGVLLLGDATTDNLTGDWHREVMSGGGGDDTLVGARGSDALLGGEGDDTINAGGGADLVIGGADADELQGRDGNDVLFGGTGNDKIYGGLHDDLLIGEDGDDQLFGYLGKDVLFGGDGNDLLRAGSGADKLFGGAGNDVLLGLVGRDTLSGGTGDDVLIGGEHADRFIFSDGFGNDTIVDFQPFRGDVIVLSGVGGITGFADLIDNHASRVGNDVVIETDQGETLTLRDMTLGALSADDFAF